MDEQQLKQAFIQYLQLKSGARTQQEFEAYVLQLGEEGLQQEYAQFIQLLQQQQIQSAKLGAKLNYIQKLRGVCPEGYEMQFFRQGGQICKKCIKKSKTQDKENTPLNPIDAFRCGRKLKKKKENGGNIEMDKCGSKMKKKINKNENGNPVTLKKETSTKNLDGEKRTRQWSDGTKSRMETSEGGNTYIGRRGEIGVTNVPNVRQNAVADSLRRVDWSSKIAPMLKKKELIKRKVRIGRNGMETTYGDPTYATRVAENEYHATMADNYFNDENSNAWDYLKGAYHWFMSKPFLGGNSEEPILPMMGTVPDVVGGRLVLTSLGKVVKTINGVKYYRNSAGELKTAQEMAKEIKAARDAALSAKISEFEKLPRGERPPEYYDMIRALKNPKASRRYLLYLDRIHNDPTINPPTGGYLDVTSKRIGDFGRGKRK